MCLFARETRRPIEAHEENEPMTRRSEGGGGGGIDTNFSFFLSTTLHIFGERKEKTKDGKENGKLSLSHSLSLPLHLLYTFSSPCPSIFPLAIVRTRSPLNL